MKRAREIERIEVPTYAVALAERRTRPIVRAAFLHDVDVLRVIVLSCYLQGLEDGANTVEGRETEPREGPRE